MSALLHPDLGHSEEPRLIHALPGRARLHAPGWSERTQRLLTPRLLQLWGVRRVQGNPLTGNVLVLFDPVATDAETVLAGLRALLDGTAVASSNIYERSAPQEGGVGLRLIPTLAVGRSMEQAGAVVVRRYHDHAVAPYLFAMAGPGQPRRLSSVAVSPPAGRRDRTSGVMRLLNDVSGVLGIGVCVANLLLSGSVFGLIVNGLELLHVCSEALVRRPKTLEVAGLAEYGNGYVIIMRGAAWVVV